jgi:hypothetical protein
MMYKPYLESALATVCFQFFAFSRIADTIWGKKNDANLPHVAENESPKLK